MDKKYISHEEALKGADPWMRLRLHLRAHEYVIAAEGVTGASAFVSRNHLLKAIEEYTRSREA